MHDDELVTEWLKENTVRRLPTKAARGADDLRYFSKRSFDLRYVIGEDKESINGLIEGKKYMARKKRRDKRLRKMRRQQALKEPRLSVLMGERLED